MPENRRNLLVTMMKIKTNGFPAHTKMNQQK